VILDYGSLCTGYDGIGMGLALAGLALRHRFTAETEPSVAQVLKLELPGVPNVGDIKAAPWRLAPECAIWSSGDPCQSISIAGRQAGRDDPRFLWPWVRAAYLAGKPQVIFFENVANIVSHDQGRTLAERFEHLREDGYEVRWGVLGACAVGAPHHRHRWYAVAVQVGSGAPEPVRVDGGRAVCGAPRNGGRVLLPSPRSSDNDRGAEPNRSARTHTGGTLTDAVSLLPTPVARDGEGRNERSPEYWDNRFRLKPDRATKGVPLGAAVNLLPTPRATDGTNGGPSLRGSSGDLAMGSACQPQHWGKYASAVALWEQVTGHAAPAPTILGPSGGVRLNPALSEWMMGLRPGLLTDRMSRNEALRAAGNGVVPLAAAAAWQLLTRRQ
jgi:DNA (cytosine-5)-methyltransferase 1